MSQESQDLVGRFAEYEIVGEQLYFACENGNLEEIQEVAHEKRELFDIAINWTNSNEEEKTPLCIACEKGNVRYLLSNRKIDVNKESYFDETPLHLACDAGQVEIVKTLLDDRRVDVNRVNREDWTPLYFACFHGNIEIVKLLLNEISIEVNKKDNVGRTPFYIACEHGHMDVVKLLINDQRVDINQETNDNETPYFLACLDGDIELVKLLLNDKRVDINKADNDIRTPFFIACQEGYLEIIKQMLVSGREIDQALKDHNGKSAIDIARQNYEQEKEIEESEAKKIYLNIIELLESFERDPYKMRIKLRIELGFAGK